MNKKYLAPFELDENLYPIGFRIKDNGEEKIEIRLIKQRDFPSNVKKSHFKKLLNRGYIENFNCFYTGMHCWLPNFSDPSWNDDKTRFYLSRDHASPKIIASILGLSEKIQNASSIVGGASYFNHKLGHVPLVLKIWLKKELEKIDYPRNELTKENSYVIYDNIIRLKRRFAYEGLYPWQPQTYKEKESLKVSQSIFNEMIKVDKEFLLIDSIKDSFEWLKEYDPTWIEKFLNN